MSGQSRGQQAVLAAVLLAGAMMVGGVLAWRVHTSKTQPVVQSQLLSQLAAPSQKGRLAQILLNPEETELLMKYIDAMGEAVANLEISTNWYLTQFVEILDASKEAETTLVNFSWNGETGAMKVLCEGGNSQMFLQQLRESSAFSKVSEPSFLEDSERFELECAFSKTE